MMRAARGQIKKVISIASYHDALRLNGMGENSIVGSISRQDIRNLRNHEPMSLQSLPDGPWHVVIQKELHACINSS